MSPILLLLLGGGAIVVATKMRKKRPLPPVLPGVCGAYWYRGVAIKRGHSGRLELYTGYAARMLPDEDFGSIAAASERVDAYLGQKMYEWGLAGTPPAQAASRLQVWGAGYLPKDVDAMFCENMDTNRVWISPDCSMIVEGPFFEPASSGLPVDAIEAPTLREVLDADPRNSVYGYVDHLMGTGAKDYWDIAAQIANEALDAPLCGPSASPSVLEDWERDLALRIGPYVEEAGGIPFVAPG